MRKVSLQLGKVLKLPPTLLESIAGYTPKNQLIRVIDEFLLKDNPKPTWRTLVEALRSVKCLRLAGKLERKYCSIGKGK